MPTTRLGSGTTVTAYHSALRTVDRRTRVRCFVERVGCRGETGMPLVSLRQGATTLAAITRGAALFVWRCSAHEKQDRVSRGASRRRVLAGCEQVGTRTPTLAARCPSLSMKRKGYTVGSMVLSYCIATSICIRLLPLMVQYVSRKHANDDTYRTIRHGPHILEGATHPSA